MSEHVKFLNVLLEKYGEAVIYYPETDTFELLNARATTGTEVST